MTRVVIPSSRCTSFVPFPLSASPCAFRHASKSMWISLTNSVSDTLSPMVRTMKPTPGGLICAISFFSFDRRAESLLFFDTPMKSVSGTSTKKRPARLICVVTLAPFVLIGSLVTCTSISCPFVSTFSMGIWGPCRSWTSRDRRSGP